MYLIFKRWVHWNKSDFYKKQGNNYAVSKFKLCITNFKLYLNWVFYRKGDTNYTK